MLRRTTVHIISLVSCFWLWSTYHRSQTIFLRSVINPCAFSKRMLCIQLCSILLLLPPITFWWWDTFSQYHHTSSQPLQCKQLFPVPVTNTLTTGENLSQLFPSGVSICTQIWQFIWWLMQTTYLNVPHTGRVIQSRVHLAHFLWIFDIPHIQAVVIVYTGKPLVGGVKGQGNRVWILRISHTREKTAAQRENSLVNLCSLGVGAMLQLESSDSPWGAVEMKNILWHL